jgi:uncharacterized protein YdaU (DUF1376 family)
VSDEPAKDRKLPFIPIYLDAYAGGTERFTTEQHGAYFLLLKEMWRSDASLPDKPRMLATIAKVSWKRWPKVWEAMADKFIPAETAGRITNKRLLREYQDALISAKVRREKSAKGNEAKSRKTKDRKSRQGRPQGDSGGTRDLETYDSSEPNGSGAEAPQTFDPWKAGTDILLNFDPALTGDKNRRDKARELLALHRNELIKAAGGDKALADHEFANAIAVVLGEEIGDDPNVVPKTRLLGCFNKRMADLRGRQGRRQSAITAIVLSDGGWLYDMNAKQVFRLDGDAKIFREGPVSERDQRAIDNTVLLAESARAA